MTDAIVTGTISTIARTALASGLIMSAIPSSGGFATVSVTASSSAAPSAASVPDPYSSSDPSTSAFLMEFAEDVNTALGSLEIGMVLAALTFGAVVTKAISYYRANKTDGVLVKATVASMLLINLVQMIATIHATHISLIVDFGHLDDFLSLPISMLLQILFTTLTACIAQIFFTFQLHAIMRNLYLTMIILFFATVQLVTSIYAVTVLADIGNLQRLMFMIEDMWPWSLITTYTISTAINITIAAVAYVRMQKPYELQKYGGTTFMSEFEYWTVKSLFFCGIFSLFATTAVATMFENMIWVCVTYVLGNLYTLSVLLNLDSCILAIPVASRPVSPVDHSESDRTSAATLHDGMVKSRAIKASLTTATKEGDLPAYNVGYHLNDGAV